MSKRPSDYLIAYIDFLGTKDYILNDTNNKHLNFLGDLYKELSDFIKNTNKEELPYIKKIKIRTFSDNILLATSANLTKAKLVYTFGDFVHLCALIQSLALKEGFLVRGGITLGQFYINEQFVYGKALLDAIHLEENIAHYPRIIIHENLEEMCIHNQKWYHNTEKDIDNIRCINFYHSFAKNKENLKDYATKLEQMKQENHCNSYNIIEFNSFNGK